MLTAFLCLVAVHNDYYSTSGESSNLYSIALGTGFLLSLIVLLLPIIRWVRKFNQDQSAG
jgi:hypothetical protein